MGQMKLGFGFYAHMLTPQNYRFAVQCGATHAVVHLVDYTWDGRKRTVSAKPGDIQDNQPIGNDNGWGYAGKNLDLWDEEKLAELVHALSQYGLILEAIENFDPLDWYDVLLGGPERDKQIDTICQRIRAVGHAGIPVIGYNFSVSGVASRIIGPFARGGAESAGMNLVDERPIPHGMVWNMWYDRSRENEGFLASASEEELWSRWQYFIDAVVPVAEDEGVVLALHPDDPPVERVRQQPKLIRNPNSYQRVLEYANSLSNKLEFCLGTLAEMPGHDLYKTVDHYVQQRAVSYIHFRNVIGTSPIYRETFLDEGDIDMKKVVEILRDNSFQGVLIPDHTPLMSCNAPWHAGMAYAMGYMKALILNQA
jgi:mannonate dehydratase